MKTKQACPSCLSGRQAERRGSGLIFAVVLLFVILGMVITLSSITMLETKMNQKTKSSVGAFYTSESGVEWILNKIATTTAGPDLSSTFTFNPDGSVSNLPPGAGYKVYLLDETGKVINVSTNPKTLVSDIKAVRSVGTQGGETQRAIEAAVAATGGGACYTNFGGSSCASDFTVVLSGYTTEYLAVAGVAMGGTLTCSPNKHDSVSNSGYGVTAISTTSAFSYVSNESCAICCK